MQRQSDIDPSRPPLPPSLFISLQVYNAQRTGSAQRLLHFARQLYDYPSSSLCDSAFIQGVRLS